jgi:hypothetical protein
MRMIFNLLNCLPWLLAATVTINCQTGNYFTRESLPAQW